MSQTNFTSGSVQTCLEVHAGWNAQTWRFHNLQEPRILCHIPKCQLDQSSIKYGHTVSRHLQSLMFLKDSCLPHHKHGTLTLERSWTMPTYVACSKIHHKYILHEYCTWGTYGQYSSNCQVSHPLLINNDDNNNKQALSVRKPVQMDKIPIVKK